jgi:trimethylamine--corrinoid protein Co-methyltransferase
MELIEHIGPGGNFITEPQSVSLCRKETWVPKLMDRNAYLIWEQSGSKSMEVRISEKLTKILKTYQPVPLTSGVNEAIDSILKLAESREDHSI